MIQYKTHCLPIYPNPVQKFLLEDKWQWLVRSIWNISVEQYYCNWRSRTKSDARQYPNFYQQSRELTELLQTKGFEPYRSIPRQVLNSVLMDLDKARKRCVGGLSKSVNFKSKRNLVSFTTRDPKSFKLLANRNNIDSNKKWLHFQKLGEILVKTHRELVGVPVSCTLKRDGGQWYCYIVCKIEIQDPIVRYLEPNVSVVGIDVGITDRLSRSDGIRSGNPKLTKRSQHKITKLQRSLSRKAKGSRSFIRARVKLANAHRKVKRQRKHLIEQESKELSVQYPIVVVENINISNMTRNSRLSGHILDAGWGLFRNRLQHKQYQSGGLLVEVQAQYSSQTCSVCGVVDRGSRKGKQFHCVSCGHQEDADINAAKVLKRRFLETPANRWGKPVEGMLQLDTRRNRKPRTQLKSVCSMQKIKKMSKDKSVELIGDLVI